MKKCRYSIGGNCTNENVACEKCNSTDYEMRACTPFQRCIALHDDDWSIEVGERYKEPLIEEKKAFTIELSVEEMKWLRVALEREGDLQSDNDNKERANFLYELSEKIR